jgi:hypothetical protein
MSNFVNLLDIVYPVGSIYISMNAESPASTVGGTWTQITNRFLYSSTSSAAIGGYEYEYMDIYVDYYYGLLAHADYDKMFLFDANGISATYTKQAQTTPYNISSNVTGGLATTKPSQQLIKTTWDNKPPYITCYMWYRTA